MNNDNNQGTTIQPPSPGQEVSDQPKEEVKSNNTPPQGSDQITPPSTGGATPPEDSQPTVSPPTTNTVDTPTTTATPTAGNATAGVQPPSNTPQESADVKAPPSPDIPPVVTTSKGGGLKGLGGKKIATILGLLLLVVGVSTGVILVQQSQDIREKADVTDCSGCIENGVCRAGNTHSSCGLGGVACVDCTTTGKECISGQCVEPSGVIPVVDEILCVDVKAYRVELDEALGLEDPESWIRLTQSDLSGLAAGDTVYFTVTGTAPDTSLFTKARFKVNDEQMVEITNVPAATKPPLATDSSESIEIYFEYEIPTGVTSFTVQAAIYHEDVGWIDSVE